MLIGLFLSSAWAADVKVLFTQLPDGTEIEVPIHGSVVEVRGPHRERWRLSAEVLPGKVPGEVQVAVGYELVNLGRPGPHRLLLPKPHKLFEAVLNVPPSSEAEFFAGGETQREDGGLTEYGVRFLVERLEK